MRKVILITDHANARKAVSQDRCMPRARGKPESFTALENAVLRKVLRGQYEWLLKHKKIKTQSDFAVVMQTSQQTMGRLLGSGQTGMSRPTALRLAEICGFDSPESLLRDVGALADREKAPQGWNNRDLVVRNASAFGYDIEAIDRVVAQYTESRYATLPPRWWMDRIVHEQAQRDAERQAPPPPPSEAVGNEPEAKSEAAPRRRRA